jgi:hypothetical protein
MPNAFWVWLVTYLHFVPPFTPNNSLVRTGYASRTPQSLYDYERIAHSACLRDLRLRYE